MILPYLEQESLFRDFNLNESWDSVGVTVATTSPFLELLAAPRDTIPPRILTVTALDTLTLVAAFDRSLDPDAPVTPASFVITRGSSIGRSEDGADGAAGSERAAHVFVEAAMIARDDQQTSQLADDLHGRRLPGGGRAFVREEFPDA